MSLTLGTVNLSRRALGMTRSKAACRLLAFFALLGWASGVSAAVPGEVTKESLSVDGRKVSYYLFVPKGIPDGARVPLLVTLHGSNRNGRSLVDEWKDLAAKEHLILAGPDAQDSRQWQMPADGPGVLCALVTALRDALPVDPRRMYIFGHSAGAVFGLYMSMLESEFFAAAAVHGGAWEAPEEFQLMGSATRKIPLAIFVGDRDRLVPRGVVNNLDRALREAGFPVETSIIDDHTHNYYGASRKINAAALAFLATRRLDRDPLYTPYKVP